MTAVDQARTAGWQLTSALRRVSRVLRTVGGPARAVGTPRQSLPVPVRAPDGADATTPQGPDVRAQASGDVRQLLPVAGRGRYDSLVRGCADDERTVLARTLAATGSVTAVEQLQAVWAGLPGPSRRAVLDPVRTLARAGRQSDGTTCGSSVLTMLAAAGDPTLALWLVSGRVLGQGRPPELQDAPPDRLEALAHGPIEARFGAVQRVLKQRTNSGALLGLPWPAGLGTPPWGAARAARYVGLDFGHRMVDDTDRADLEAVLESVARSVERGAPVPLYSGGDSSRGLLAAMPRHVVLVIDRTPDGFSVWEPSAGKVQRVTVARLLAGHGPVPALGGWSHVVWAVLPRV